MNQAQVYKGKLVDYIKTRHQRCKHFHVSGRQCGVQIYKDKEVRYCPLHKEHPRCTECESMKLSFVPPKGW